ncbi:Asx homology domain-containing protein [Trichoderma longibrachiatum]
MSATSPAPADEEPTPRPEANAELEPAKAEIPPSSTLSSLSELESPFTPARLRRKVTSTQPVIESPSKSEAKSIPRRPKRKTPAKKKAPKKLKWDAESIIKDPKSPLATANLRSILCNPMAWTCLDQADRAEILALFPDRDHILDADTQDARPNLASLMNDDSFRYDCAAYTENIAQGRHDPEWLASAWSAHERRKAGDFDEFLVEKLEEDWGVEIPAAMRTVRGVNGAEETEGNGDEEGDVEAVGDEAKVDAAGGAKADASGAVVRQKVMPRRLDDQMEIDELAA